MLIAIEEPPFRKFHVHNYLKQISPESWREKNHTILILIKDFRNLVCVFLCEVWMICRRCRICTL